MPRSWGSSRVVYAGLMILVVIATATVVMLRRSEKEPTEAAIAESQGGQVARQSSAGGRIVEPIAGAVSSRRVRPEKFQPSLKINQESIGQDEQVDEQLIRLTRIPLKGSAQFPPISADTNPASASVIQAVAEGKHPERLSPVFAPAPFDREQYLADPEAYLGVHEPGRAYQSAQPGSGVPVLEAATSRMQVMKAGESVRLSVRTQPGLPATFTAFDNGVFENGLPSQSVAANAQGEATVTFRSSLGQQGELNVLAASPVASERVHFTIFVEPRPK